MRWTNRPKVFLEVAVVKLCQLEDPPIQHPECWYEPINQKISQLENEVRELKQHGVAVREDTQATPVQKTPSTSKGFQAPAGKINEVLKHATKQDLTAIRTLG